MLRLAAPMLYRLVVLMAFAAAFCMLPLPAHPQSLEEPMLVVATEELDGDRVYRRTVMLAVPLGGDVHVGVILNRPTDSTMGDAYPEHAPSARVPGVIHFGGPAHINAIFAMVYAGESPGPHSLRLMPGLWLVADAASIDRIIETRPKDARYYLGSVIWKPGQLAQEVDKGWLVVRPMDKARLFMPDTSQLYENLAPKAGQVGV